MRRLYADSGAVMRARTRFHPPAPRRRAHTAPPLQSEYQRVPEPRSSRRQRAECHRSCRIREARSSSAAVLLPAHAQEFARGKGHRNTGPLGRLVRSAPLTYTSAQYESRPPASRAAATADSSTTPPRLMLIRCAPHAAPSAPTLGILLSIGSSTSPRVPSVREQWSETCVHVEKSACGIGGRVCVRRGRGIQNRPPRRLVRAIRQVEPRR